MQQEMTKKRSIHVITRIGELVAQMALLRDVHTRALGHLCGKY